MNPTFGVHHPRRARVELLERLVFEQFGVPRERNNPWYDVSHGFWTVPRWWMSSDGSLEPQAALERTLAEQTWGQTHSQTLAFPGVADHIFLGSLYAGSSASRVVLLSSSYMAGATVMLNVSVTGNLTVADASGNLSTVTVAGGKVTVPVREIPTYLQLPAGATVTVATVNGWATPVEGDATLGLA